MTNKKAAGISHKHPDQQELGLAKETSVPRFFGTIHALTSNMV
jgi:hypothetical protein